jgi:L-threonylcarbamoyladenylate synthase
MAEILKIDPSHPEPERIARAAEMIRRGQVIAIPTDTFYGLAANPFDLAAVETVFAIKGRPKGNPLLLLVDSLEMAGELSQDTPAQFPHLAKRFWPGPLTIVVNASPRLPPAVTAQTGTIGLRLPRAPIPLALVRAARCPITATSANLTGEEECSSAEQVERSLGKRLPLILDGGISQAEKPSTVLKLDGEIWEILREGAIPRAEIATFFAAPPLPGKALPR